MICGLVLVGAPGVGSAAEIRIRATGAVQHTLIDLAAAFDKASGHTVKAEYGTAGHVALEIAAGKLLAGKPVDLVFSSQSSLGTPEMKSRLQADAPIVLGSVRIGIGVRDGDQAPDISTPDALKAALLAAPSFAYGDPASGATTGIHFAKLLDSMGIAEAVRSKALLRRGGLVVMQEVADGKAAFGFTQTSEIKAVAGVKIAGYLPEQFQLVTTYAGALLRDGAESQVAAQFLSFVTGPTGRAAFKEHGFDLPL